ncbi:MAG: cytochrome c biogenesis protein [Ktedonobacterales bacterium]
MGIASSPPVERARSRLLQAAVTVSERVEPVLDPVLGRWLGPVRRYGELVIGGLAGLGMLVTIWAALMYAPLDVTGNDQRILYLHVPVAWCAFLAFFIVGVASVLYLIESAVSKVRTGRLRSAERWDRLAWASAEVGVVFTTLTLISGSIWGKADWGAWWVWDARLTTTLILWFIYVGYLLLRSYMGQTESGARAAAVVGIIGFIDVPIVYESVNWWNTIHPTPYVLEGDLPGPALLALMISLVTFTLLFVFLLVQVYKLHTLRAATQELRARIES